MLVGGLRFDDADGQVRAVAEEVVGSAPAAALDRAVAHDADAAIGEVALLLDRVGRPVPSRRLQGGHDELPAGIASLLIVGAALGSSRAGVNAFETDRQARAGKSGQDCGLDPDPHEISDLRVKLDLDVLRCDRHNQSIARP